MPTPLAQYSPTPLNQTSNLRRRVGAVLGMLMTAAAAWPTGALAVANYVYHERTGNDPGCGGQYVTRLNPSSAQSYPMRFKIEYQFFTDTASVYYTTDGSTPLGAYGNASNTTQIASAAFGCTFGGPIVDQWEATIPAQSAGAVVKYIVGAWHSGGGLEVFANGGTCGGCGDTTNSAAATVFQYTVGSTTDLYWDANGSVAGAGGATPAGVWGTDSFWSSVFDGTAATEAWTAGRNAVFAAGADATGAYTVSLNGPQSVGSLSFEEGLVTLFGVPTGTNLTIGGSVNVASGAAATVFVSLAGTGGLTKSGAGLLTLRESNSFSGSIVVNSGILAVATNNEVAFGVAPVSPTAASISVNDSTLRYAPIATATQVLDVNTNRGMVLGGSGATIDVQGSGSILLIGSPISGGTLTKTGPGEVRLYGAANSYANLIINEGTFTVGQGSFVGTDQGWGAVPVAYTPNAILIQNGATNRTVGGLIVTNSANRGITLGAGGGVFRNDVQPLVNFAPIVGVGGLRKEGNRSWTNNAPISYAGPTIINGGTAASFANVVFNGLGTATGPLTLNAGRLFLNHANAFSAITVVNGRIDANTNGCLGTGTITFTPTNNVVFVNATTLGVGPVTNVTVNNPIIVNATTTLAGAPVVIDIAANAGREFVLNGKVSGDAHWKKDNGGGSGALVLGSENNDFTGVLTNFAGTLIAAANNALGAISGGTVINNASSLAFRGGINYSAAEPVSVTGMGRLGFGVISNDSGNCSFAGPITMSGNSGFGGIPGATLTLSGVIGETGGARTFAKLTPNTIRLTAANLYSGGTLVSNGTLVVANTTGSATGPGPITIFPGGALSGPGTVTGDLTVSGVLAPGSSPGTLNTGNETWNGGGSYVWEINNASGTAGADPGWDLANITGNLIIAATSGSKFTINITSLTLANAAGDAANFDNTLDQVWTIATASGVISGFDPAVFNVVSTNFSNARGNGLFLVEQSGNNIRVRFVRSPGIAMQPISASAECVTGSANFSVTASGTAPLSYQWRLNGSAVPGGTAALLSLNNVTPAMAGLYDCVVTNLYGSVTSMVATLSVLDTMPPVITNCATNQIIAADASCQGMIPNLIPQVVAGDACGSVSISQSPMAGTLVAVNTTNNITLTVTDSSNNTAQCVAVLTVIDLTPPTITCPTNLTGVADAGTCAKTNVTWALTASDNCSVTNTVCSPASGSSFNVGVATVSCVATDASGNTNGCTFTVTISDTEAPVITCPANITGVADAGACAKTNVTWTLSSSDNCSVTNTVCSPASGSSFNVGVTTVTCIAADASGNTNACTFTVTISDTQAPSITCPANLTGVADAGTCGKTNVSWTVTTSDNCSVSNTVCSPASGSTFVVGMATVNCVVTDASGNTNACSFTVTISDTEAPSITCPANIIGNTDGGLCTKSNVTWANPTATDNCTASPAVVCVPASASTFSQGATIITCTATDGVGLTNACTFTVTINDAQAPTIACPANITTNLTAGCTTPVTFANPVVSDNCPGATFVCVPANGSIFSLGATTVICTPTDASLNVGAGCTFTVTVNAAAPVFTTAPVSQTTPMGNGAVFTAAASGTATVGFQWRTNGVNVSGATATTFAISNLALALNGMSVSVVASNCAGTATASTTLTVTPITGISFDFNTPGQYTNAPYNLVNNDWANSTLVNAQPFGPVVPFEVSTGGVGVATGGGGLDLMFNQGNGQSSTFHPLAYDFSLPGKTLHVSAMTKIKLAVNSSRNTQIGFTTQTNLDLDNNAGRAYMSIMLQSSTNISRLSFDVRQGTKPNGANTFIEGNASTIATLFSNQWYRLSGVFSNNSAAQAGTYVVSGSLQDMGGDGLTPGATVANFGPVSITNVDVVASRSLFLVLRNIENAGADYVDNVFCSTTDGPVFFVQQPAGQTVAQGRTATFRALVDGSGPYTYQWFKDGTPIPGAGNWKYITPPLLLSDNGAQYTVSVTSTNNTITSVPTTVTVTPDSLDVLSVGSVDGCVVGLRFDQPVTRVTAENPANYLINGVPAVAAQLLVNNNVQQGRTNGTEVLLTPASPIAGAFTVTVANVSSISGTLIGANNSANGVVAGLTGFDVDPVRETPSANITTGGQIGTLPGVNYSFAPNQFTVTGGGHDIFGNFDGFRYVYTQKTGDFDVKVRVPYLDALRTPNKGGFNARVSLSAYSPNIGAYTDPQLPGRNFIEGGTRQDWNIASVSWGNNAANIAGFPNVWVRFRRAGNSFTRYSSTNGVNWQCDGTLSPQPIFPSTLYLGLAVNANVGGGVIQQQATAQFDNYGDFGGYPGAVITFAPTITNATVAAGNAAGFFFPVATVSGGGIPASGGGELVYLWQRSNGAGGFTNMPTAGATNNTFSSGTVYTPDNGAVYRVIVSAPGALSVTSVVANLTVTDTAAPTVAAGFVPTNSVNQIYLNFSEFLSLNTATNPANYTVTNGTGVVIPIASVAVLNGDTRSVVITTVNPIPAGTYGVRITGVQDLNGNSIVAATLRTFRQTGVAPIYPVVMEFYGTLAAAPGLIDLTNNIKFQRNTPDLIQYSNVFGWNIGAATFPNTLDNYGVRMYSYFVPTQTQQYVFWIRADDFAAFYMNTNAVGSTNPAGRVGGPFIGANNPNYNVTNVFITPTLTANQRYYVEFLFKESTGGDGATLMVTAGNATNAVPAATTVVSGDLFAFPDAVAPLPKAVVELYTGFAQSTAAANGNLPDLLTATNAFSFISRQPNILGYEKYFGYSTNLGNTSLDNYLGRIYSYFIAPSNGLYKFWIRADDSAQLWMNTNALVADNTTPTGMSLLGGQAAFNASYTLAAQNVSLVGGKRYYMEGRWREGAGGDGMTIAVRSQGDTGTPGVEELILGNLLEFPTNLARVGPIRLASWEQTNGIAPFNPTVNEGQSLNFVAQGLNGAPPYLGFTWLKNGVPMFLGQPFYVTPPLMATDDQSVYTLVVTNLFSVTTASSKVTVITDLTQPTIVSAIASQYGDSVLVTFSEPVSVATAQCLANFRIPGLAILGIDYDEQYRNRVSLRTTPQTPSAVYNLIVNGVRDMSTAGNMIAANSMKAFTAWGFGGCGAVYVEIWTNIPGSLTENLTADPRFIDNLPDTSYYTNVFAAGAFGAQSGLDFYGARVSGFFMPPSNGLYRFYIRSDDGSKLFMNTNGSYAPDKVLIARSDAANSGAVPNPSQYENGIGLGRVGASISPILSLTNGTAYYMEALLKEGGGGDHVMVVMRAIDSGTLQPTVPLPATAVAADVVPGTFFGAPGNPDLNQLLIIQSPPPTLTVGENDSVALTVVATAVPANLTPFVCYQWQKFDGVNYTNIVRPNQSSLTFSAALADNGSMYRVLVSMPGIPGTSYTTLLTVTNDITPPYLASVGSVDGLSVGICFNELVDTNNGGDFFSYSVNGGVVNVTGVEIRPDGKSFRLLLDGPVTTPFTVDAFGIPNRAATPVVGDSTAMGRVEGFTPLDVGAPPGPGNSYSCNTNEIDVVAGGADIWTASDQGHMTLRPITGNFDVWARLHSLSRAPGDNDGITKAGIMVRESFNADARKLHYLAEPPASVGGRDIYEAGTRPTAAAATAAWAGGNGNTGIPAGIPNTWIRIKRTDNLFSAFRSSDGVNWTLTTTQIFALPSTLLVGLGTTAHVPSPSASTTLAEYRNIHIPFAPTITGPTPPFQSVGIHQSVSYTVTATSAPDAGAVTYQWRKDGLAIPGANAATLSLPNTAVANSGIYSVDVGNDGGIVSSVQVQLLVTNLLPVVVNDSLLATQNLALTFASANLVGNDSDPEGDALSVVAAYYPLTIGTNFDGGGLLGSTNYGSATNDGGVLKLTAAAVSQAGSVVLNELTPGKPLSGFVASFTLRIGDGSAEPADGFSFNFANDLPNASAGARAAEDGLGSGFSFCVDNYRFAPYPAGGNANSSGMKLRYGGVDLVGVQMPTWNQARFVPVIITVSPQGLATVNVDGTNVFANIPLPGFAPVTGRFGIFARTGGEFVAMSVDDLSIYALASPTPRGGMVLLSGGNITYTPPTNACGMDTFFYLASDGQLGGLTTGRVDMAISEAVPQPPVITTCPPNRSIIITTNCHPLLADLRSEVVATDNCCCVTFTQSPVPGTPLNIGANLVTNIVTDTGGLSTNCITVVTVIDPTAPVIICSPNLTAECTSPLGAVVSYSASASDFCDAVPTLMCSPASGSVFPLGVTTVRCVAYDASLNTNTCSFSVTVNDTTGPVFVCPATIVVRLTNQCTATVNFPPVILTDCDTNAAYVFTPASGSLLNAGTNIVTVTAYDTFGNTNRCSFLVAVIETVKPAIVCPPDLLVDCGNSTVPPATGTATATDNCDTNVTVTYVDGSTVEVLSTNRAGWVFSTVGDPLTSSAGFTAGPATAPLGTGSLRLAIGSDGDNVAQARNTNYHNVPLNSISELGFRTYRAAGGASQSIYVILNVDLDGDGLVDDLIYFEPRYQDGDNPMLPNQGALATATWQSWNAMTGGWFSLNYPGLMSAGPGVQPLATYVAAFPTAKIVNTTTGAGGVRLVAGLGLGGWAGFDGSVDQVTIGVNGVSKVHDFDDAAGNDPLVSQIVRTWTAMDDNGNLISCSQVIKVRDITGPVISCSSNLVVECSAPGGAMVAYVSTANDACEGSITPVCLPASGSFFAMGMTTVNCSAADSRGYSNSCSFTITVRDTTPPAIVCSTNRTVECVGGLGTPVSYITTTSDVCDTNVMVSCTPASGSLFSLGATVVNCAVSDVSGNSNSCSFTVTVQDTTPPAIVCSPNRLLECTSPAGAVATYVTTATDVCDSVPSLVCSPVSGSTFPSGVTTVQCLATDASSNSNACSFTVTVVDTTPPTIVCSTNISVECASAVGSVATYVVTTSDICDTNPVLVCTPASGSTFAPGVTTVRCVTRDSGGNSNTCSFTVSVVDTTPPTIVCSANLLLECTSSAGAVGTFVVTTSDICDTNPVLVCTPASGSTFAPGATTVNCVTTDSSSNSNSCSFTVTVQDTTAPAIVCSTNRIVECTGGLGTTVAYLTTATDACDTNLLVVCTPASGSLFPLGTTMVGCSVADVSGNSNSCSFTVTVQDTTPPVVVCSSNLIVECTSPAGAVATYVTTATDVCDTVPSLVCSPVSGSLFAPGLTIVHCLATDATSNSNACSFTITVVDTTAPAIVCSTNVTVECASPAGAVATYVVTTSDICDTNPVLVCSPVSGSLFSPGATTVRCVSTDANSNSNACSFTVTVRDTMPPSIMCPANRVVECGTPAGTPVTFTVTASDICDTSPVITSTPASGSIFPPGVTIVTNVARDASGNSNVCTFTVTVRDTTPPVRCANPPVIVMGGVDDNFIGVEPASPSVNLQARLSSRDLRNFDEAVADGWFGHSFGGLPSYIAEAKLRIKLRADFGVPENDTIQLLFTGPGGSAQPQEWNRRIGSGFNATPGLLPTSWSLGAETELVLNLGRLTNANASVTDLLPQLRNLRFLDVIVQDDTLVDYVVLELTICQCQPDIAVSKDPMACGANVAFPLPPFADNCDPNPSVVCVPASGSFFPVGTTLVVCTATDASGNSAVCTFNVTVQATPEPLSIALSGTNVIISWSTPCVPGVLEETGSLNPPIVWSPVGAPVVIVGPQSQVTLPATGQHRYFRLRQ